MKGNEKKLKDIFLRSPIRELEEVEKVNSKQHAQRDVEEFCETESAEEVISKLINIIGRRPAEAPRFMYMHASFGSGKTLLLKLIGFTTEWDDETKDLASELSNHYSSFKKLRRELSKSPVDNFIPIFLNLLNRDPTQDPPIPLLIYQAMGTQLGYPTDPLWLLEWTWRLDVHQGLWEKLRKFEHNGKTFEEALEERASLRGWLYEALPAMSETEETPYSSKEGVKESIKEAEQYVSPGKFDPKDLVKRIEATISHLEEESGETYEFLIGLDEVALFIGDNPRRYREFRETVETLIDDGPNPPVIGTGQWSLSELHRDFLGEIEEESWYTNEIELKATDTEIITQKRWLRKKDSGKKMVEDLLDNAPDLGLTFIEEVEHAESKEDAIQAYPFRRYDLWLLRQVMEELITRGHPTEREYIHGRALLVLVRSIFTKFGWSDKQVGPLVSWNTLFDLLVEETTLIPTWVQDKLSSLESSLEVKEPVKVAKVLYLINRVENVPSTASNVARLLTTNIDEETNSLEKNVQDALKKLQEKRYVRVEEKELDGGPYTVYRLLSEEAFDVAEEIGEELGRIPPYQLNARFQKLLQENDLLAAEDSKQEVTIQEERNIPLVFRYSVLDGISTKPKQRHDAVIVRVLANKPEELDTQIRQWQEINQEGEGLEDLLVAVEISEGVARQLRWLIASEKVLSRKSSSYPEIRTKQAEEKRELEQEVNKRLAESKLYDTQNKDPIGTYENIIRGKLISEAERKFCNRKSLSTPLRESDDAQKMRQFFREEGSVSWPLSDEDAEMLGVDVVQAKIKGGWAEEFLDNWGDAQVVTGEELLEEIEGRDGKFLGTAREALAALLLCLAATNKIGIKKRGERIGRPEDMGRAVRTKEGIRNIQIRPGAMGPEKTRNFKVIFKHLKGSEPPGSDPEVWIDNLSSWIGENSMLIKRVNRSLNINFSEKITIESLVKTLESAMSGGELSKKELLRDPIPEQARRFYNAKKVLVAEEGKSPWDKFVEEANLMQALYPSEPETHEMQEVLKGEGIPDQEELKSLVKKSQNLRRNKLQEIYKWITKERTSKEKPEAICEELKKSIREKNEKDLRNLIEKVEGKFSLDLDSLENLFGSVIEENKLKEEMLSDASVRKDAEIFNRGGDLLEEKPEGSLWSQLKKKYQDLQEDRPDSRLTLKLKQVISGPVPPTVQEANQLLEEAEHPETEETETEPLEPEFEKVWSEITDLEEDSVVLIDLEEDSN